MATINVRGYANKPATKEGSKGQFHTFTLSERIKGRNGDFERVFYNVVCFKMPAPPDGAYVTLNGYLNPRKYLDKNGVSHISLDVTAIAIDVMPPKDVAATDAVVPAVPAGDPWEV